MTRNRCLIYIVVISILLGGAPLSASVNSDQLERAITMSQGALKADQNEEGYWLSYVQTNTLYTSLQVLLYYYLNKEEEERETIEGLCRYLVHTQSEDGSWPFYDGGRADLGLTTLNYFALKLSGYSQEDPLLMRARDYVLSHGGAESVYGIYQITLALFDQYHFSSIPDVPLLPLLAIAPQLSWIRIISIPLMVVLQKRAFFHPPEDAYITELFLSGEKGKRILHDEKNILAIKQIAEESKKECGVDISSLDPFGFLTDWIYLNWLLAKQNTTDGLFYDSQPNTFFSLLSLKAIEDIANQEDIFNKALEGLRFFQEHLPIGIHQTPADATIPATFSTLMALYETNLPLENPVIKKGVEFLWSRQHRQYGDWVYQMVIPVLPGGWGFNFNSQSFPDTDDTATTLLVLKNVYGDSWSERWWDFIRGIQWLLAMQNRDGGWGTWDRKVGFLTDIMKEALPDVVLNESVVDHSTRVLIALSSFGYTKANSFRVGSAVRWIKAQRLEGGSWSGTWFVDYVYQTANVLGALSLVKAEMSDNFIQESLNYILEKQRDDGGWGESPSSFSVGQYVPLGYSSPSQTALILYGLLNFLRGRDYLYRDQLKDPINNAINFILSTQGEDGLWKDPTYVGVVFPQVQYMRYPRFQESSILGVLGMYHQDIHYYGDRED